ncbi:MAG: hypothetical protein ACTSWW_12040 [Promethearchaeota archaeon]
MNWGLFSLGIFFLIFRIWITEFKLREELQFRRHYLSRFLNYYYGVALLWGFTANLFNFILIADWLPMIIAFIGWDMPFFIKFKRRSYWKNEKNRVWLLIERATLHPPMIGTIIWMTFNDLHSYVNASNLVIYTLIGSFFVFLPWFLLDHRWTNNYIGKGFLFGFRWEILIVGFASIGITVAYFLLTG